MTTQVERRDFLKTIGAAGIALAGGGMLAACSPNSEKADASPDNALSAADVTWEEETDVLIVGTGFAGLAAAIEAKEAGCEVIIVDKMSMAGGNSAINGGEMAAVGTPLQVEAGVEDSIELMVADMLAAGKYYNHEERVRKVVENSAAAVEWCTSLGVEFDKLNYHGGHSVPRINSTVNTTGADVTKAEIAKLEQLGVKPTLSTKLERLIEDESGRIIGAELRKKYQFGNEDSGSITYIKARKGVVLTAGGFSNDVQMRTIHEPRLVEEFTSTNQQGATGEVLRETQKHNAMTVHLDWIQLVPFTSPDEIGFGYSPGFTERLVGYGLMVDPETGKRFVSETENRKVRSDTEIEIGHPTLMVCDATMFEQQVPPVYKKGGLESGVVKEFSSLEALADEYDMPKDAFIAEVDRWNGFVETGIDEDFGAKIQEKAAPTKTPPFYAARLWPKVHHTMGGVVTTMNGQVIDQDYEPIPGLYAAGEITGGTHGAVRLGGCAITDCLVFGRIAGQEVAKEQV